MITYTKGDILQADAEALVNTVNCVGVMGRGIALQFKKAYPENFKAYVDACRRKEVKPGYMFVFETNTLTQPSLIVNFPTKRHWRSKSRLEDIKDGLKDLAITIGHYNIRSIAIPPLGSGLGGLHWSDVKPHIEVALRPLSHVDVLIFEPQDIPLTTKSLSISGQSGFKMTSGRAVLVKLMQQYLSGLLDPFVTLLEVHKLMYFMQEAGEPLRLNYKPAPYGPYAENLRHVLHIIEGHLIRGYGDGGDAPYKPLELMPNAVKTAQDFLEDYPETQRRFERVAALVEGFESPFGLELLSTVHWVCKNDNRSSLESIIQKTHDWSDSKRKFNARQIQLAVNVLQDRAWI